MIADRKEIEAFLERHFLFKQLEINTISKIALECGVLSVKPDKDICIRGSNAKSFFIIFSGSARMNDDTGRNSILTVGDCFGHEALAQKPTNYHQTVTAQEQSIILLIEPAKFQDLIDTNPDFKKLLRMEARFAALMHHKKLSWLNAREDVKYITRRHSYDLYRKLVSPLTFFLIALIVSLVFSSVSKITQSAIFSWFGLITGLLSLWSLWLVLDWQNDYYVVTNQRVVLLEKTFLFYETRQETPLEAIQTIGISTELLGRLLAYGSISLKTFTGTVNLHNLEAPALVVDILDHYISSSKLDVTGKTAQEYEKMLQKKIAHPDFSPVQQVGSIIHLEKPPSIQTGRKLFALKEITPDGLIYRTHWFILIKKTALSLLLFCVGVALFIFYFQGQFEFIPKGILLISSIVLSIIGLLSMIYQFADWRNDQYIITREQLIDINRKPLGHEEKRAAPLKNIQTIEYKRKGIFGLLFNFGTVFIRIGDTDLTFDYVHNPSQVQQDVFAHFMQISQENKKTELQAESDRMMEWIKAYHHITKIPEDDAQRNKNG